LAFARDRDVLARKSAGNDVASVSPCRPVEVAHVFEDREQGEDAVSLSFTQDLPTVWVDFDGADWLVAEQHAAKNTAADAGE
jgi:hypothetical protein